jgi:hypothetical protein
MLCKITIGWSEYILPNDTGAVTIMKALSKAIKVDVDERFLGKGMRLSPGDVKVSFEYLPGYKLTSSKQSAAIEPDEILPPVRGRIAASSRDRQLPPPRRPQLTFNEV